MWLSVDCLFLFGLRFFLVLDMRRDFFFSGVSVYFGCYEAINCCFSSSPILQGKGDGSSVSLDVPLR